MAIGKPLHLRLFLEGEEVPVISAQITVNINSPSAAAIQILPLSSAMNFHPRTMVHLFFLDTKVEQTVGLDFSRDTNGVEFTEIGVRGTYRLLWSGEMIGFSYVQTPQSRGLVLQCVDFSSYWDQAHAVSITYGPGGNLFTVGHGLTGGAVGTFDDLPGGSIGEKLVEWIKGRPLTPGLDTISGLAGGVIRTMEIMGGVPGHYRGINDFFTVAELRCRILNQITAEENDQTASRILSIEVFHQWLKNGIQQAGGDITFRGVMKILLSYIFYEFVPNPAPKFDSAGKKEAYFLKGDSGSKLKQNPTVAKAIERLETAKLSLELYSDKETERESDPHAVLDIEEGVKDAKLSSKDLRAARKALRSVPRLPALASAIAFTDKALINLSYAEMAASTKVPMALPFRSALENTIKALEAIGASKEGFKKVKGEKSVVQRLRTQIVRPDCWFASPPACNVIFPEMYSQVSYDRNYMAEVTRALFHTFDRLIGKDHLLANHHWAPAMGIDSKKLIKHKGEASYRVLMNHEMHTGILPKVQWIPNTASAGAGVDPEQAKKVQSGRLTWMMKAAMFHFFKYRFASRNASVAGRFNPFVVCGFPAVIISKPFILKGGIKAALGQAGIFRKGVTEEEALDVIHAYAGELGAPSHLIGMIAGVIHNIDQSGGTTSVSMHHVRNHRGIDDEFLGVLIKSNEGFTKRVIKVLINRDKAKESKNPNLLRILIGVTPQSTDSKKKSTQAKKSEVVTVSQTANNVDPRSSEGSAASFFTVNREQDSFLNEEYLSGVEFGAIKGVERTDVLVPSGATSIHVGEENKGVYGGKIVGIEVLGPVREPVSGSYTRTRKMAVEGYRSGRIVVEATESGETAQIMPEFRKVTQKYKYSGLAFEEVAIYEEIKVAVEGNIPIEDVLKPSWFSNAYSNKNIGEKIYRPFFGCDSVVGGLTVVGKDYVPDSDNPDDNVIDATDQKIEDVKKIIQNEEKAKRVASVERALNQLAFQYGQIKTQGQDVDSFIRDYIDRPIATYEDIFGDPDLQFTIDSSGRATPVKVKVNGKEVEPKVGFHTTAVHPQLVDREKLTGLTSDPSTGLQRVGKLGKNDPIIQYDMRKAKKDRVRTYLQELEMGPGFMG